MVVLTALILFRAVFIQGSHSLPALYLRKFCTKAACAPRLRSLAYVLTLNALSCMRLDVPLTLDLFQKVQILKGLRLIDTVVEL